MITKEQIPMVLGHEVYDAKGDKVGEAEHVFLDNATGDPEWVCVKSGLFGAKKNFVPLRDANLVSDHVEVAYEKDRIKDAPDMDMDAEGRLRTNQEEELYRYYGLDASSGQREREGADGESDEVMTRSEEQLRVSGRQAQETGRARLRKYVVTEERQVSVPVTREEVRIEREPITDADHDEATSSPEMAESEREVTLHEERPVVEKQAVPVEKVRMGKEQVSEEQTVSEEVRKERIDVEGDEETGGSA